MKHFLLLFYICLPLHLLGQTEGYVLETEMRNPVDTTTFSKERTLLLFVHDQCGNSQGCPTHKMQIALEKDSLGVRNTYGIKLYVIYPHYSKKNATDYHSLSPVNSVLAFYTESEHFGTFGETKGVTPFMIFYDGKGHKHLKEGGTFEDLCYLINERWRRRIGPCQRCNGTGQVKPNRHTGDPDWAVGICPSCRGSKRSYSGFYY